MRTCGVEIRGKEVIFALVTKSEAGDLSQDPKIAMKLQLTDDSEQEDVRSFFKAISAFAKNHNIDHFSIRARAKGGGFASGGTTFKIEGLVQIIEGATANLIYPVTVSSRQKKSDVEWPKATLKYQQGAVDVACAFLVA